MEGRWVRSAEGDTSVVFVHGILSTAEKCWRHHNGSYWPELLAQDKDLNNVNIYLFTYRSDVFSGSYRLGDAVDSLKEHLGLDGVLKSGRVIFVCHSMGGIVVRRFLCAEQSALIARHIAIGLFLVASPSIGSRYANWLSLLAKAAGNSQADALRFEQNNAWLNDLDKEFVNLKAAGKLPINGKELIEDNFIINRFIKLFWRKQIVEYSSGARYFPHSYKVPHSDHETIAKPADGKAIQHRLLCQFIKDMLEQHPDPPSVVEFTEIVSNGGDDDITVPVPDLEMAHLGGYLELLDISLDTPLNAVAIGEDAALRGRDVFFQGPEGSGKTTALNAFLRKSASLGKRTVFVNLFEYGEELRGGPRLWQGIAQSIYDDLKSTPLMEPSGDIRGHRQLTRYLFTEVLTSVYPVAIAFDEVGRLRQKPLEAPFWTMIRAWRERDNSRGRAILRIGLAGLERLREIPPEDEEDRSSRRI